MRTIAFGWFTASGELVARPGSLPSLLKSVISEPECWATTSLITDKAMSSSSGASSLFTRLTIFLAHSGSIMNKWSPLKAVEKSAITATTTSGIFASNWSLFKVSTMGESTETSAPVIVFN